MSFFGDPNATSGKFVPITKANTDLTDGVTKALWVGTAGTANLKDEDGNVRANVPLVAGLNPFRVIQVRTSGTASDIWGLY